MSLIKHPVSAKACTLSMGIVLAMLLAALSALAMLGQGQEVVELLATLLVGYEASLPGLVLGAVWGFFIGVVLGGIYAFFYNRML